MKEELIHTPEQSQVFESVHVYPIVKRSSHEIKAEIERGKRPSEISYNNVIFLQESCPISANVEVTPSSGQMRPLLERLEPYEEVYQGARRILEKQTPFTLSEFPAADKAAKGIWVASEQFKYTINSSSHLNSRHTTVTTLDVNRSENGITNYILPEKYKGAQFIVIPTDSAMNIIRGGSDMSIIGSSVMGTSKDITVDSDNLKSKDQTLALLCENFQDREVDTQKRIFRKINYARRKNSMASYASIDQATSKEIIDAFEQLSIEDSMKTFREQKGVFDKRKQIESIAPENFGNWFGTDLIFFAQILAGHSSEDISVWKARSTKDIAKVSRFLRDTVGSSIESFTASNKTFGDYFAEVKTAESPSEASILFLKKVERLYQDDSLALMQERFSRLFSAELAKTFAKHFGIKTSDVEFVMKEVETYLTHDVDDALSSDPEFIYNRQLHRMTNEVNNASLATLLFQTLGIKPDERMDAVATQICHFESARSFFHILKGLSIIPYYRRLQKSNGYFNFIPTKAFGPITETVAKDMPQGKQVIYIRGNYIVDEKPKKSFRSFLRKAFQTPVEEIKDLVSINVALRDSPKELNYESALEQINKAWVIKEIFWKKAEEMYGKEWEFFIEKEENNYEVFLNYLKARENGDKIEVSNGGKRAGSQAQAIPREKIIWGMRRRNHRAGTKEDVRHYEMTTSAFNELMEQTNNKFMGFGEKLGDDRGYMRRRLLESMTIGVPRVGFPSVHRVLYPPDKLIQGSPVHKAQARK